MARFSAWPWKECALVTRCSRFSQTYKVWLLCKGAKVRSLVMPAFVHAKAALAGLAFLGISAHPAVAQVDPSRLLDLGIEILRQTPPPSQQRPRAAPSPRQQQQPATQTTPRRPGPQLNQDVLTVQRRLHELGYDPGPRDGRMGPRTRAAIAAFQRDEGLPATGRIDAVLMQAIAGPQPVAPPPAGLAGPAMPPRQSFGGSAAFTVLDGFDLPYSDYRSGRDDPRLSNIKVEECQQQCALDSRCRAFTYNINVRVCILKDAVPQPAPFAGAVSGIRLAGEAAPAGSPWLGPSVDPGPSAAAGAELPVSSDEHRVAVPGTLHDAGIDQADLQELARDFGMRMHRGLPVVAGSRSMLTAEQTAAASRFFDFVELGLNPGLIELDPHCWALNYLPEELRDGYLLVGRDAYDAPGRVSLDVAWRGSTEFEAERSRQAFLADHSAAFRERAAPLPLEVMAVIEQRLDRYDVAAGGFSLRLGRLNDRAGVTFSTLAGGAGHRPQPRCAGGQFLFSPPATLLPELWEMDRARAEHLLPEFEERTIYVAVALRFRTMPLAKMEDTHRAPVWSEVTSVRVYADPDLARPIETLPLTRAEAPLLLTGLPDTVGEPETAFVDEESVALMLFRDHGDILSPEAWRRLMLHQAEQDSLYHQRRHNQRQQGRVHSYAEAHIPFFPNGFSADVRRTQFTEAQMNLFRQWMQARAAVLPDRFVYQGRIVPDRSSNQLVLNLGSSPARGLMDGLLARGYVPGQIRQATIDRGVGTPEFRGVFLRGQDRERVPVLVLANLLEAYAPDLPATELLPPGTGWRTADVELRITETEVMPLDDRRELLVLHATPTALRILSPQRDEIFRQAYDVAALDLGQMVAPEIDASPPALVSLPFSAEVADLLMARFLPDELDETMIARMLLARWHYEVSFHRRPEEPEWGRFFVVGAAKPDAQQLRDLAPRFREWTLERARAVPSTVTLALGRADTRRPGPIRVGADLDYTGVRRELENRARSCSSNVQNWARGDTALLSKIENACAFFDESLSLLPREVLLAPTYPARATERHLLHLNFPNLLPRYSGMLFVGPRVFCPSTDPYCRAGLAALEEELFEQKVALNDVLVLDQEVVIPDSPQIARLSDVHLEIDLEVTGIRRSERLPPHPVIEAFKQYFAFMEQLGIRTEPLGAIRDEAVEVPVELFLFDARIKEARLVEQRSRQPVATLPLQPPRTLDTGLLQEVEPEQVAPEEVVAPDPVAPLSEPFEPEPAVPHSEPFGPEVAGLRLGMTFEEAERIVREHMPVGRILVADRAWHPTAATGEIEAYSSGRLFESADGAELIVLYDEPPAAPGIVVAMVRQLTLHGGVIRPEQVHAQLEQRYGRATASRSEQLVWIEGGTEADAQQAHCEPDPRAAADLRIWRVPEGDESGGQPWSLMTMRNQARMPGIGHIDPSSTEDCSTVLTAIFDTSQSATWDHLVLRLVDHGRYRELFQASKDIIARDPGEPEMPEPAEPTVDLRL